MVTKWRQNFFKDVEPIILKEPLAYILGAQDEGEPFVINYTDVVLLAGHSCPAVSGAYKSTQIALKALFKNELPTRGEIRILIKGGPEDLAYGPQAQVMTFITGASGITGFKGLGSRFGRKNKLFFDSRDMRFNEYYFQREDTGATVKVTYNPQALTQDMRLNDLSPKVMRNIASKEEKDLFVELWQGNVKRILIDGDRILGLFEVEEVASFEFPKHADASSY